MKDIDKSPVCFQTDCFACQNGYCVLLTNNFGKRDCPFFKTEKQIEKENAYREERLADIKKGF